MNHVIQCLALCVYKLNIALFVKSVKNRYLVTIGMDAFIIQLFNLFGLFKLNIFRAFADKYKLSAFFGKFFEYIKRGLT